MKHRHVFVAGYPSFYGGADVEMLSQIELWRRMGAAVTLAPISADARTREPSPRTPDPAMRARMDALGCATVEYRPGIFAGRVVVSFCNGNFLAALPRIWETGRPAATVWANTMTWNFPLEVEGHRDGMLTHHLYQTDYQRRWVRPALDRLRPVAEVPYVPFYDLSPGSGQGLAYAPRPRGQHYCVGRISRDDAAKYPSDLWRTFDRVLAPVPVKAFVLGYGEKARAKCGPPRCGDWQVWAPGAIPAREFYPRLHTMIHRTGGSRENLPRVMMEAWHAGVALVCEDDYGFAEHVADGVTGFRCRSSDEMAFRASQLAFDDDLRMSVVAAGRRYLEEKFADADRCWANWATFLDSVAG